MWKHAAQWSSTLVQCLNDSLFQNYSLSIVNKMKIFLVAFVTNSITYPNRPRLHTVQIRAGSSNDRSVLQPGYGFKSGSCGNPLDTRKSWIQCLKQTLTVTEVISVPLFSLGVVLPLCRKKKKFILMSRNRFFLRVTDEEKTCHNSRWQNQIKLDGIIAYKNKL